MTAASGHRASFYVKIKAGRLSNGTVRSIGATGMTKGRPSFLEANEVAVKLTVQLPDEVFDALTPEAVVIVPVEMVQQPVQVEPGDAA